MDSDGFVDRLTSSTDLVLLGFDLVVAAFITGFIFISLGQDIINYNIDRIATAGTTFASAMVAVILTGISILITMSDKRATLVLKSNNDYSSFLFTFEFTAMLALGTAVIGLINAALGNPITTFYIFLFSLIYTILSVATSISRVITYGDKLATMEAIEEIPDDIDVTISEEAKDALKQDVDNDEID